MNSQHQSINGSGLGSEMTRGRFNPSYNGSHHNRYFAKNLFQINAYMIYYIGCSPVNRSSLFHRSIWFLRIVIFTAIPRNYLLSPFPQACQQSPVWCKNPPNSNAHTHVAESDTLRFNQHIPCAQYLSQRRIVQEYIPRNVK